VSETIPPDTPVLLKALAVEAVLAVEEKDLDFAVVQPGMILIPLTRKQFPTGLSRSSKN
jgi:hypothetical protein